ncbi:hypothetical protein M9457_27740, partial [Klebsiella pneumoniae]|nr:hypothetical protein [Klebsiella pneumoniae]
LGWQPPEATYLAWIDLRPLNVDDRALQQALIADTLNNAFPALGWQPPEATYLAWIDLRPLNVDDRALQQALIA